MGERDARSSRQGFDFRSDGVTFWSIHKDGELAGCGALPVEPRQLVVLAVHVVVALLGAARLVAGQDHRRARGQQQRGEQGALAGPPVLEHLRVVRRALDAAVPAAVVVAAVVVVLAVGLVVFVVVGDQVGQREAVMGGDEVDGVVRPAAVVGEPVGRPGQTRAELGQ